MQAWLRSNYPALNNQGKKIQFVINFPFQKKKKEKGSNINYIISQYFTDTKARAT